MMTTIYEISYEQFQSAPGPLTLESVETFVRRTYNIGPKVKLRMIHCEARIVRFEVIDSGKPDDHDVSVNNDTQGNLFP